MSENSLNVELNQSDYISIDEGATWASEYLDREISKSNISYLVQYGKLVKYNDNGSIKISITELKNYYDSYHGRRELDWKEKLGSDLNWALSFDQLREKDTTKHVHRLHPYKGKYIPQLVEYFLDDKTDEFKTSVFFKTGDTILDPFCGSGTTLVQSNELGMHSIGIDVSDFNATISNTKINKYDLLELKKNIDSITKKTKEFLDNNHVNEFRIELRDELYNFNSKYFPTPDFRYKVANNEIDQNVYGKEKEDEFLSIYSKLIDKYSIKLKNESETDKGFINKWYIENTKNEIRFILEQIKKVEDEKIRTALQVILSRATRSCRATTHSDLATLIEPQLTTYYCYKHKKICKPIFSALDKWRRYANDTVKRFAEFDELRTSTFQYCLTGDSKSINLFDEIERVDSDFGSYIKEKKIDGIFSSPPYVGLIDYHEQHAYAYDLFGLERNENEEIGRLSKGKSKRAQSDYVDGIVSVLTNSKKYLKNTASIFLVANDRHQLYDEIANRSGLEIINKFKRPVLNRTEKDKSAYSEIIFHMKIKK